MKPRRKAVARSNSSLFTSIGSFMGALTTPFTWLKGSEEDDTDEVGKRRRNIAVDDGEKPTKRQRIHSPEPYLDPPKAAFPSPPPRVSIDRPMVQQQQPRDHSMPPIRPSFRMRTSLTPQPITREISEPPTLSSLIHKPMFIHPPPEPARKMSAPTTLGSLVESHRSTRSPMRQHSLLFGSPSPEKPSRSSLHDLDVYKTPLVPTRLRSVDHVASSENITDMFRRRPSKLIPMFDDSGIEVKTKSKKSKKRGQSKEGVNETKPYAGEGGMKKLLARRKEEAEQAHRRDDKEAEKLTVPVMDAPSAKDDWLSLANAKDKQRPTESSLRVGRTLTERKHIHRPGPLGPIRSKFSATFEEEEDMTDNEDKKMLDEAAKRAPAFQIPEGFTFDLPKTTVAQADPKDKEPPITSLPFSFSNPSATVKSPVPAPVAVAPAISTPEPALNGIPQFFANIKQAPPAVPAPSSLFTTNSAPAVPAPAPLLFPVKDDTNPFWDGEKKMAAKPAGFLNLEKGKENLNVGPATESSVFGSSSATPTLTAASSTGPLFGAKKEGDKGLFSPFNPAQTAPVFSFTKPAEISAENKVESSSSLFGGPSSSTTTAATTSVFGAPLDAPKSLFGTSTSTEAPKSLFASSAPAEAPKSIFASSVPAETTKSIFGFGDTDSKTTEPAKPATSLFGAQPAPATESKSALFEPAKPATSLFVAQLAPSKSASFEPVKAATSLFAAQPAPIAESKLASFEPAKATTSLFGAQATESKPALFEPTKPATSLFAAQPTESKPTSFESTKPAASLFGAQATESKPTSFSFAPTASLFSFGDSSNSADTSKPFVFGVPAPATDSRAVTPPRESQDSGDRMDESPTRDVTANGKPAEPRPTLGGAFSFPSPSNPFSFNASSSSEENKPAFGGFGQTATTPTSSAFSFNAKEDPPRPSTTGSFPFSNPASSSSGSGFSFGAPSVDTSTTSNPFAQQGGSAPSSPSTFATQSSFTFGTPSTPNPFSFGSQPSSPAATASGLPPPAVSSGTFTFGAGSSQPSTPFGAPSASSGSTLFNMGSVSTQSQPVGARQIKKLPTRRGGKR